MASRREDLGSWLEGTPGDGPDAGASRLGLPREGPGAHAGLPRRLVALAVDWTLSMALSAAFFPAEDSAGGLLAGEPWATLAIFGVSTAVLVSLLGHTVGHRLCGLQVVRLADLRAVVARGSSGTGAGAHPAGEVASPGRLPPPGVPAGLLRTLLLCLAVPPVVWDKDGRGLHDTSAGTVLVRR